MVNIYKYAPLDFRADRYPFTIESGIVTRTVYQNLQEIKDE